MRAKLLIEPGFEDLGRDETPEDLLEQAEQLVQLGYRRQAVTSAMTAIQLAAKAVDPGCTRGRKMLLFLDSLGIAIEDSRLTRVAESHNSAKYEGKVVTASHAHTAIALSHEIRSLLHGAVLPPKSEEAEFRSEQRAEGIESLFFRAARALNRRDISSIENLLLMDAKLFIVGKQPETVEGAYAIGERIRAFLAEWPEFSFEVRHVVVRNRWVAAQIRVGETWAGLFVRFGADRVTTARLFAF